jgi:hypothetical protein
MAHAEQRSRRKDDEDDYEDYYQDEDDEEELSRTAWFSHQVRKTTIPKEFKLPTDKIKYEGVQEPNHG